MLRPSNALQDSAVILVRRWRNDNLTAYWDFLPKQLLTRDTFPEADLDLLQSKSMACPAQDLATSPLHVYSRS